MLLLPETLPLLVKRLRQWLSPKFAAIATAKVKNTAAATKKPAPQKTASNKEAAGGEMPQNADRKMRNIAHAKVIQTPRAGFPGPDAASATELVTAANVANASMASIGKLQEKLTNKKQARGISVNRKHAQSRCRARRNATWSKVLKRSRR
ncbi:hypothetical protein pipiens_011861 [Culex pipiens pipiens]|uniref:Uncharacterized protein n=1 Tax=Culex pipiens pipiens TaxID=38569 RepID=A0ABD1D4M8_CULPP